MSRRTVRSERSRREAAARSKGVAVLAAFALLAAAGCAGPRPRAPAAPLAALVTQGDAALAAVEAPGLVARRPGDPWARLTAALLARRAADAPGEAAHLVALAAAAPGHPSALLALRRLTDLADESPEVARAIEAGLAPLAPRLAGLAAYRARVARIAAAEALGDHARVAALRVENGAVTAWTLAGPLGVRRAVDFVRPVPGEDGVLPEAAPGRLGAPPVPTRTVPAPDGTVALEGEPMDADVFLLAADVTLARGGRYLVSLGTAMSARVSVDGAVLHERRDFAAHLPTVVHVPVTLAAGVHRVVVKVARAGERVALHLAFAREDGAASDATAAPARPGTPQPAAPRPQPGPPALSPAALADALAPEAGRPIAAWLAGLDAAQVDREGAKALLSEAAAALPRSAMVRATRAGVIGTDPTLDEQVAQGRAEADLREAIVLDPGHVGARLALAALLRMAGRLDDAEEVLQPAAGGSPSPALGVALARVAEARGLAERAEALVAGALASGARCRALDLARELAARRRAVVLEDERARARAECRDGRERLAEHLRRRGDAAGAARTLAPVVAARPWAVEPSLALAAAHVAGGEPARAAEVLEALRAIWPRSARIEKRLADVRELLGDAAAARAARERALLADGADLSLRRDLALEDGREVLDDWAEDAASAVRAYAAASRTGDTSAIMVLDAAAVEFHPGGAHTERTHQVILVRDPRGVDKHGEVSLPPGAEILAVRTLKRDGRSLEPERVGAGKGSISLAGLEPGDSVRVEYVRAVRPEPGGSTADTFFFREDTSRLWRSTYVVVAPDGMGLEVEASGVPAPAPSREGGKVVYRVVAEDVAPRVPEPNQPPLVELMPWLRAGVGGGRDAVQLDFVDGFASRARSTAELRAFAARVRAQAGAEATLLALARAAWAAVAKEILGGGGSFSDDASEVLSRGRGGRLFLLKAVLAELGVRARVALARPFTADPTPRRFPSHGGWSHALLRIEAGGEPIWHDASLRTAPLGTVTSPALGVEALVLGEPGEPLEVTRTPERVGVEERRELSLRVALRADGGADVEGEDRYLGATGAAAKLAVERLDATERRQVVEGMLARSFRGFTLAAAELAGEGDPASPLAVRWRGTAPAVTRAANGGLVIDAPFQPARLAARYVQVASRSAPLVVGMGEVIAQRVEIVAPEGFVPEPAADAAVDGPFGRLVRTERAEGRTLVREERLELLRGRIPPEKYAEFAAFASAVDRVQERPVSFRRVPTREGQPSGATEPGATRP